MKKLVLGFLVMLPFACANNCLTTNAVSTASNLASTYVNCGATSSLLYDNSSAGPYEGSGTSTWTLPAVSLTNGILLVGVSSATSTTDSVTGVTDNGVSMTQLAKYHGTWWSYWYISYAPASGSHTLVASSSAQLKTRAISYGGGKQSGQPDATGSSTGTSSAPSVAVTTVNNDALVLGLFSSQFGLS